MSPLKYFALREFKCKCGCGAINMEPNFLRKLDNLRGQCVFPFVILSGYRCPSHNSKVSTTGPAGPHTTGRAVDIAVRGTLAMALLDAALESRDFTGFGIQQKGTVRFIHLDDLPATPTQPRPTIWTY